MLHNICWSMTLSQVMCSGLQLNKTQHAENCSDSDQATILDAVPENNAWIMAVRMQVATTSVVPCTLSSHIESWNVH